jgi:hypothetical protein
MKDLVMLYLMHLLIDIMIKFMILNYIKLLMLEMILWVILQSGMGLKLINMEEK